MGITATNMVEGAISRVGGYRATVERAIDGADAGAILRVGIALREEPAAGVDVKTLQRAVQKVGHRISERLPFDAERARMYAAFDQVHGSLVHLRHESEAVAAVEAMVAAQAGGAFRTAGAAGSTIRTGRVFGSGPVDDPFTSGLDSRLARFEAAAAARNGGVRDARSGADQLR